MFRATGFVLLLCAANIIAKDDRLFFTPGSDSHLENDPQFRFASYYKDNMVLQQSKKKPLVWGFANASSVGKTVDVTLHANDGSFTSTHKGTVRQDGATSVPLWAVQLSSRPAGGPYTVTARLGNVSRSLEDVLFGDVWLCSGQSNMVFGVGQLTKNSTQHEYSISKNFPNIRLFLVSTNVSKTPLLDLDPRAIALSWAKPSPDTLRYFSAVCWLYGRHLQETLDRPIGLITSAVGGTPVEAWSSADALRKCGVLDSFNQAGTSKSSEHQDLSMFEQSGEIPVNNSVLWNAMIHPFANLTIRGAIWYQGEENAARHSTNYDCTFPAMIEDWRSTFYAGSRHQTDKSFPFGFVMLGPANGPSPGNITSGFPSIRWQQTARYGKVPNKKMKHTFMAVATDLADFQSPYHGVHFRDKESVGTRLALAGLYEAYKVHVKHTGPEPTLILVDKSGVAISFDTDIYVRNTWGFEVCCSSDEANCDYNKFGRPWVDANITEYDTRHVLVSLDKCTSEVLALRYIWRQSPCEYKQCAVYSIDNELPAPPIYAYRKQLDIRNNLHFILH